MHPWGGGVSPSLWIPVLPPTVSMRRGAGRCASLRGEGSPVTLPIFMMEGEPHFPALHGGFCPCMGLGCKAVCTSHREGVLEQSVWGGRGLSVSTHGVCVCVWGGGCLSLFAHRTAAGVLSLCIPAWRGNLCALHPCMAGRGHHFTSLLQGSTSAFHLHMGGRGHCLAGLLGPVAACTCPSAAQSPSSTQACMCRAGPCAS